MPVREKPTYSGEGQEYVENWSLKNSSETFDAKKFEAVADKMRGSSVTNILAVAERIKKKS